MAIESALAPPAIPSPEPRNYSLTGANARRAVELGLAEAEWYQTPLPRETLRALLERKNGPAIRDSLLLVAVLAVSGYLTAYFWGTWWALLPYFVYATFYGTSSDSRWHECGHGTAFRTDWMNNAVYEIASFMVMRESVVWRWSHNRHHSDTIIVGRDPEIQIPRPPDLKGLGLSVFNIQGYLTFFPKLVRHSLGRMDADEKTFIPPSEFPKVYARARIYLLLYAVFIGWAIIAKTWLPIFLFVLPQFFGTWLMIVHNTTQHAGLAENVLDHRLNCRTVHMNPVSRFIYWNMNYHLEHHMFPLVPYHALPRLHALVKADCPPSYGSILSAWREIWPAISKQVRDPSYYVRRKLPDPKPQEAPSHHLVSQAEPTADGWLEICAASHLGHGDVVRFDHRGRTFALARDTDGRLYATDGICTHGNTHLADGLVKDGIIECPKHNGRFHLADGSPARAPICRGLATYPLEERHRRLWLNLSRPQGVGARAARELRLRVVSNRHVATFIRELVLEPASADESIPYQSGDYLQLNIPTYSQIHFRDFQVPAPYADVWQRHGLFSLAASNAQTGRRNNYSLASNSAKERHLKFNVRIAMPPPGQDCPPGVGSSYVFNLKPGDTVTALGPFGEFHLKPTQREIVFIGGGAGMAPLRAHLSQLFENEQTMRKVSYWYGARSKQEVFYDDYFEALANAHSNFTFRLALSAPLETDHWTGLTGFIHEVVQQHYLQNHPRISAVEFYLCGPPMMIKACTQMLTTLGVNPQQIAFDEF